MFDEQANRAGAERRAGAARAVIRPAYADLRSAPQPGPRRGVYRRMADRACLTIGVGRPSPTRWIIQRLAEFHEGCADHQVRSHPAAPRAPTTTNGPAASAGQETAGFSAMKKCFPTIHAVWWAARWRTDEDRQTTCEASVAAFLPTRRMKAAMVQGQRCVRTRAAGTEVRILRQGLAGKGQAGGRRVASASAL